jgi:hypothetical protein
MNKYFDNQAEPQLDEPEWTRYGEKVFGMVKDMEVKFRKKKKERQRGQRQGRESGIRWRNRLLLFLSRRSQFSLSTCHTRKH